MLATQISYWDLQERKRHNIATEGQNVIELERKQKEYELAVTKTNRELAIARDNLEEAKRHNLVAEGTDKSKAQAALKQAQAALKQAEVAQFNAETNLKRVNSEIKLNKSQIGVNKSIVSLNRSNVAVNKSVSDVNRSNVSLNRAKEYSTYTQATNTAASTAYTKERTKTAKKDNKYYMFNNVVPNAARSARDVIDVAGTAIKGIGKGFVTGKNTYAAAKKAAREARLAKMYLTQKP